MIINTDDVWPIDLAFFSHPLRIVERCYLYALENKKHKSIEQCELCVRCLMIHEINEWH